MSELQQAINQIFLNTITKAVISKPAQKSAEFKKIAISRLPKLYQLAKYTEKQVFHENISFDDIAQRCLQLMESGYLQLNAWSEEKEYSLMISKKGKVSFVSKNVKSQAPTVHSEHNRQKQYIIPEGKVIEPLVDMGIFTKEGKVVASMYDKYKQINRFIEIIDDAVVDNILDNDDEPDQIGIYLQRIYDTIRADNIDYFN